MPKIQWFYQLKYKMLKIGFPGACHRRYSKTSWSSSRQCQNEFRPWNHSGWPKLPQLLQKGLSPEKFHLLHLARKGHAWRKNHQFWGKCCRLDRLRGWEGLGQSNILSQRQSSAQQGKPEFIFRFWLQMTYSNGHTLVSYCRYQCISNFN